MSLFVQSDDNSMWYTFTITHVMRFELATDFVAIGISFQQVAKVIERQDPGDYGPDDWHQRLHCQPVPSRPGRHQPAVHRCACAFASTAKFLNLHLKAIPILDSHTTEKSFNMMVKFFDALYEP
uniref:Uncharacterized protein n=1 Tax=Hyaloperonospora arabidopsidis (strain Emoy2) TaxID=559515 RepID=M4BBN5_HYAAE